MRMTQLQHFYKAHRDIADCDATFMELIRGGLTRDELARLIAKRPALWSRYSAYLKTLTTND
jgi:hypothetical protein